VLDPFTGSGSTGMAAVELDYDFTGCELDPAYVNIATQRITAWKAKTDLNNNPLPEQWFTTGE
jgi:DNA modification methylase